MGDLLVEIKNVSKVFEANRAPALDNINAIIPKGQIIGLVGPDGAGKTTLIRLITGLLLPTKGGITVSGFDTVTQADSINEITGYMPQKFGLYEDLTVQQNLNLYADLQGVVGNERKEVFDRLLAFTGLKPFTDRLAGALSGGMKQKLGLACSLIQTPKLLLLDEPSVGIDPLSRRELWKMVNDLLKLDISVVWSTAYLDEAEKCDSVILLNAGKMLYNGPPNELTKRVDGRTFKISNMDISRRFVLERALRMENVIDGVIQGNDVRIVTREKKANPIDTSALQAGNAVEVLPTPPRFEDAFIDILGGGPGGISLLTEKTPELISDRKIVIKAHSLTKRFGTFTAADNISFEIPRGKIFGLLGPNGAGKSTIFKMLSGLLNPTSGKAFVNGYDLEKAPSQARSQIGYMAQKFSLYKDLSVYQNLNFFSGLYELWGRRGKDAIKEMIDVFGFETYINDKADLLPLGYKQRLALSCTVMHHPAVLFLDEPTSGVDPITRREFWNHINGMVEKGVTILVTTHFMEEAEYCDEIALIYRGKVISQGSPDALKQMAQTKDNSSPTLEDAFVRMIQQYDEEVPIGKT